MEYTFDYQEMFTRIVKYLIEGLVVGIVAAILPEKPLSWDKVLLLGLTAAAMFSILDLVAPSISTSARQGAGLGLGFNLVGFPMRA
uniref:Holin n=1 Tax=viral metagenome TaxID=1070528 RepID=A0A6C0CRS2_9ZZZZ